jgi:undecaprenyl-diphosphatase
LTVPQSLYLGIIQGLTEFLPISSTAHLILAPNFAPGFLKFTQEQPHAFDVALHVGTLLALLIYFRDEWRRLIRGGIKLLTERTVDDDIDRKMALLVILGCIPAAIAGPLLDKRVEELADPNKHSSSYLVMGIVFIVFGLLMGWVDRISRKARSAKNLSPGEAIFVGVAQAVALIPGVSRSGATITAGLLTGLTREAAARFSFLISAPVVAGAAAWTGLKLLHGGVQGEEALSAGVFIAGILASAVVGWLCIHFLLEYLRKRTLWVFVYYRVVLGIFLIALFMHNR